MKEQPGHRQNLYMCTSACAHQGTLVSVSAPAYSDSHQAPLLGSPSRTCVGISGACTPLAPHCCWREGGQSKEEGRAAKRGGAGLGEEPAAKGELGSVQVCRDEEEPGHVDQSLSNLNMHTVARGACYSADSDPVGLGGGQGFCPGTCFWASFKSGRVE